MKRTIFIVIILICTILLFCAVYIGARIFDREFYGNSEEFDYKFKDYDIDENSVNPYNPRDIITVGLYNSGYLYHEDHDHGISKDIIIELFKRMNLEYEFEIMPRARISPMLEEGSLPMSVSAVRIPEREEYAWFVPYFAEKNAVLIRKTANISSEEELLNSKNIKVGIVRGYYYGEYYMGLIEKLKEKRIIVETKDIEELFKLLKEDWIQVTFNNPSSYLYYFEKKGIKDVEIMDFAVAEEPLIRCLIFSKKCFSEDYVKEFEKKIAEMNEDGTLYKIFTRYLSEEDSKKACDF